MSHFLFNFYILSYSLYSYHDCFALHHFANVFLVRVKITPCYERKKKYVNARTYGYSSLTFWVKGERYGQTRT